LAVFAKYFSWMWGATVFKSINLTTSYFRLPGGEIYCLIEYPNKIDIWPKHQFPCVLALFPTPASDS